MTEDREIDSVIRLDCYRKAMAEISREELESLLVLQHLMLVQVANKTRETVTYICALNSPHAPYAEKGSKVQDKLISEAEKLYKERTA